MSLLKSKDNNAPIQSEFEFKNSIEQINKININDNVYEYLDNISEYIKDNFNNSHISKMLKTNYRSS